MDDLVPGRENLTDREKKPLSEQKTLDHFERRLRGAASTCADIWKDAQANQEFVSGGEAQWDAEDWKSRKANKRPTYSLNHIVLAVNSLSGQEITNRYETSFVGRDNSDQGWVGALSELDRWALEKSRAADQESDAYRDLLMDRLSVLQWRMDPMRDPDGFPSLEHPPIWEMVWDPCASAPGLLDREWDARGHWLSIEEFLALFPDQQKLLKADFGIPKDWADAPRGESEWPWVYRKDSGGYNRKVGEVFVADYQWRQRAGQWVTQDPQTGETVHFDSPEALERWSVEAGLAGMPLDVFTPEEGSYRWEYRSALIVGRKVVREGPIPYGMFTRQFLTSWPVKSMKGTKFRTLVDISQEIQRLTNASFSIAVAHMARANKGGIMYEDGFFENEQEASSQIAKPFPFIKVAAGALSGDSPKFKELADNAYPQGLHQWLSTLNEHIWAPMGLNPATLGVLPDPRRVSGKVFGGLSEASASATAQLTNSLRVYRQQSGELRLRMYAHHYSPVKIARIVGPQHEPFIPARDPMSGQLLPEIPESMQREWMKSFERDVVVGEKPASMSEKFQVWDFFTRTDLMGQLVTADRMPMDVFIDMIPDTALNQTQKQEWKQWVAGGEVGRIIQAMPQLAPEQLQQIVEAATQYLQQPQEEMMGQPQMTQ